LPLSSNCSLSLHDALPISDVVLVFRRPPHTAVGAGPQPPLLPLLPGHFQPLLPPEPVHALAVDAPALAPQQRPDPPVAVARVQPDRKSTRLNSSHQISSYA